MYENLTAACGGVLNPETLTRFQLAMREYEAFMAGLGELLAPLPPEDLGYPRKGDTFSVTPQERKA